MMADENGDAREETILEILDIWAVATKLKAQLGIIYIRARTLCPGTTQKEG